MNFYDWRIVTEEELTYMIGGPRIEKTLMDLLSISGSCILYWTNRGGLVKSMR